MNSKSFILQKNVTVTVLDDIIKLQKGIFNFTNIEILKDSTISEQEFDLLKTCFKILMNNEVLTIDDSTNENVFNIFVDLNKYEFLSEETLRFLPKYFITDFSDLNLIKNLFLNFRECETIVLNDLENIKKLKETNVLILVNSFSLNQLKEINNILINNKVRAIYLLNDGEYVHALYVDNKYTGCFECFAIRMISRIDEWEKYKEIINNGIDTNLSSNWSNISLLLSFINVIIEKSNRYNSLLLESKIFSIYLPNLEFHVDRLLKVPFCATCGYSSKRQSQELNINLKQSLRELMKDEN